MRRILELGEQKSHEKEPPNAWVFRVLDLDPTDCAGLELRSEQNRLYCGALETALVNCMVLDEVSQEVRLAVESWMKFGNAPDDHARAVTIVICNEDRSAMLLQRKDLKHPNTECQGKYSLFGGSPHVGEDVLPAAYRELLEEIRHHEVAKCLHGLKHIDDLTLYSIQWPETYVCSIFVLSLPNDLFDRFVKSVAYQGDTAESVGVILTRHEFLDVLWFQEALNPGRNFVASHHIVIKQIFRS